MKSIHAFIIKPKGGDRYKNEIELEGGKKFVVNTDIFNHEYVSREAEVIAIPTAYETPIKVGDTIIVHHNIFRRWHDQMGRERNSSNFISEDKYTCFPDQIYMHKSDDEWKGLDGYCFVSPVEDKRELAVNKEVPQMGTIEIDNKDLNSIGVYKGDVIGFLANREYEFVIEGKRLYRMRNVDVVFKYDDRQVEVYNPNWANHFN